MAPDPIRPGTPPAMGPAETIPADAVPRADAPDDAGRAQARKLEQIKDFYLTAEAIGEENLDKHFDQLLAHQRELIGEYFRQSTAAKLGDTPQAASRQQAPRPEAVADEPFAAEKPRA